MDARVRHDIKALSAFYTPKSIADELAKWVVRKGTERILEPSVGDGALIVASINRAKRLCGGRQSLQFLAYDIDPDAIANVSSWLPEDSDAKTADFLNVVPSKQHRVDAVIANPPFTRNHSLLPNQRTALRKAFKITGAAGLWVHFLLHSKAFLVPGGRIGAVIPAAGLFSTYGRAALQRFADEFSHLKLFEIVDRTGWLNGADERGALLLADGFQKGSCKVPSPSPWSNRTGMATRKPPLSKAFAEIERQSVLLGSQARISIGLVTGNNDAFLLSELERLDGKIDLRDVKPVVSRTKHIPGISIDSAELRDQAIHGAKTWLLLPLSIEKRQSGTRARLATISRARRRSTVWFGKRTPWWRVKPALPCDAIFTYMNHYGPRLVLATSELYCTNTLHHLVFHDGLSPLHRLSAAVSMVSTFGQLAAERIGRTYGGGVLKLELNEVRRLPIILSETEDLETNFLKINDALREGDHVRAREIADQSVLPSLLGRSWRGYVREMLVELNERRETRSGRL